MSLHVISVPHALCGSCEQLRQTREEFVLNPLWCSCDPFQTANGTISRIDSFWICVELSLRDMAAPECRYLDARSASRQVLWCSPSATFAWDLQSTPKLPRPKTARISARHHPEGAAAPLRCMCWQLRALLPATRLVMSSAHGRQAVWPPPAVQDLDCEKHRSRHLVCQT